MITYPKIAIVLAILFVIGTGLWLRSQYTGIKMSVYEKREADTIKYVNGHVLDFGLAPAFLEEDPARQQKIFEDFFNVIQTPEIFRVKVFDRAPKIVWSNLPGIIGQDASQNQDTLNALKGESRLKVKKEVLKVKSKAEYVGERQFENFSETYVPVKDDQGNIVGVFEAYQTMSVPNKQIKDEFRSSVITAGAIAAVVYLVVLLTLRFLIKPTP